MGKQQVSLIKFLIYTKHFTYFASFNPHDKKWHFTKVETEAESLSNFFKVMLPAKGLIWVEPVCV